MQRMSTWIILSWVLVAVLTAINIFVFLKLKQATEQMMKMAFPNAKNMNDAMGKMQQMMGGMGGMGGMAGMGNKGLSRGPVPGGNRGMAGGRAAAGGGGMDNQLKAAMDMLQQMQKGKRK